MANNDKSRAIFNPRKHYTAVHQQQGRVVTDFDVNDAAMIAHGERQRARVDIIGGYGSPDSGYRVDNARIVNGRVEFDLLAGTLYIGGVRLELEDKETFQTQSDWLQVAIPNAPLNQPNRRDLVVLEVYEAPVTAVEDGELLDPALGGADTAVRIRRFARVGVIPNVNAVDCDGAWEVIDKFLDEISGGKIAADCQRIVDTRLKVTYTTDGVDDDLCDPPRAGGYLGAENQAIRVQLVDNGTFTWGFNNATPAYRVSLSADRTKVTLITPPRDEYSMPVVGQVIEILPWGARLSNGEKTAALSGHLTRITAVDPSDEMANGAVTVTLADAVPTAKFEDWRDRPDANLLEQEGIFYFMHIWDRGSDVGSPVAIPFTKGMPVTLGTTGIQVTFTGDDAAAEDAWVIAARPETPNRVLPWDLETAAVPVAVRRYYAPLGLIKWGVQVNNKVKILDCRPPFRPLTAQNICCTFTVGDGKASEGDFNDLSLALDNAPDNAEVCLLPGVHRADVRLIKRKNLTISGCGGRSKLIPLNGKGEALIDIAGCENIGLYNFDVICIDGTGIAAERVSGLHIEHVRVMAKKVGIDVETCQGVMLYENTVRMLDSAEGDVGIYAQGDDVTIERCDVQIIPSGKLPKIPEGELDPDTPIPDPTDPCEDPENFYANILYLIFYVDFMWGIVTDFLRLKFAPQTLGGIQIGSGSEQVLIRENRIIGGAGNGITLGSDIADIDLEGDTGERDEFPDAEFTHSFDLIEGQLIYDNKPIGGQTIFFDGGAGQIQSFPVNADGKFIEKLQPGKYRVYTSQSEFGVAEVEPLGGGSYVFYLKERGTGDVFRPVGGADVLAFIYDVLIERNTISQMGVCGIGSPRFTTSDAAAASGVFHTGTVRVNLQLMMMIYMLTGTITGFVVDVTITENTITRCLLNAPPLTNFGRFTLDRALGGIALALVDGFVVDENRVEDCGAGAERAICGIYAAFAVDATVRDNHVLNNGQDTRELDALIEQVSQIESEFDAAMGSVFGGGGTAGTAGGEAIPGQPYQQRAYLNQTQYNAFRQQDAMYTAVDTSAELELERGPRGGIVLPVCFSANLFAGGAVRETKAVSVDDKLSSLRKVSVGKKSALSGLTSSARGRHAARIDGNTVVQPFGKALFLGAAGTVSITDNMLVSDQALTRELDASAGGISGLLASAMVLPVPTLDEIKGTLIGVVDYFGSAVAVFNLMPGAYVIDFFKLLDQVMEFGTTAEANVDLSATRIPFGFPDGNILFLGNQVKQGDALARGTVVSLLTMDDVNFSDNQVDVLNATNIMSTTALFGVTVRAANNRFKEPLPLLVPTPIPGTDFKLRRHSLFQFAVSGAMMTNQGHLCFLQMGNPATSTVLGNFAVMGGECNDQGGVNATAPKYYRLLLFTLVKIAATFAAALSK